VANYPETLTGETQKNTSSGKHRGIAAREGFGVLNFR